MLYSSCSQYFQWRDMEWLSWKTETLFRDGDIFFSFFVFQNSNYFTEEKTDFFSPLYPQDAEQEIQMCVSEDILKRRKPILMIRNVWFSLVCLRNGMLFTMNVIKELSNDFPEIYGRLKTYMRLWTGKSLERHQTLHFFDLSFDL